MKSIQIKFLVALLVSIALLNAVLCAPQGEQQEGIKIEGTGVSLDNRINWVTVADGVFTVFEGAKKIVDGIRED